MLQENELDHRKIDARLIFSFKIALQSGQDMDKFTQPLVFCATEEARFNFDPQSLEIEGFELLYYYPAIEIGGAFVTFEAVKKFAALDSILYIEDSDKS
jgi:hypothetical protein